MRIRTLPFAFLLTMLTQGSPGDYARQETRPKISESMVQAVVVFVH